jgi:hypothetical protein
MQRPPLGLVIIVAALSPLSLVLAHNLVFLLSYGDQAGLVLRETGHDTTWADAVRLVVACSGCLGVAAVGRLVALWVTARRLERGTGQLVHAGWRGFGRQLLLAWVGIALVSTAWFLFQENAERGAASLTLPMLSPLFEGGLASPLLVIPVISLLTALVGTLFRWSVSALLARITAARLARTRLRPVPALRPASRIAQPTALLARHLGLRAPPPALVP